MPYLTERVVVLPEVFEGEIMIDYHLKQAVENDQIGTNFLTMITALMKEGEETEKKGKEASRAK